MATVSELEDLWVYLSGDYSQIELRILAEASNDALFIKQFQSGEDIHCLVGHELTDWPIPVIAKDKQKRRTVKEFHFGIVYGEGVPALYAGMRAKGIQVSRSRVSSMYDRYFKRYSGVRRYMEGQRKTAEEKGYVETLFGFRREIFQNDSSRGTYWGNQAINTPIQGSAHQLVLLGIALLDIKPKTYHLLQNPIMEVHDEMVFVVRLKHLVAGYQMLKKLLEEDVLAYAEKRFKHLFRVPLLSEMEAGFCYGSRVDYAGESVEKFLEKWRAKHKEISGRSFRTLLPERK